MNHPHPNPQCSIRIVSGDGREFYMDLITNMAWGYLSLEEAFELFQKHITTFYNRIEQLKKLQKSPSMDSGERANPTNRHSSTKIL